jgi:UTP-glucose-1-phosphate uridylyltransferase
MKPTLLILAAGIGSRYGSMKQTEQFGPSGETITDYSIYDALKAGFGKVVFVISPEMEEEFCTSYVKKFPPGIDIDYVLQSIHTIPEGFHITPERKKPWGTAHAVLMAAPKINEPFAVINADDFYGKNSCHIIADYLTSVRDTNMYEYSMVGFSIRKTLSKYGTVSRGVCEVDENGYLTEIIERVKVKDTPGGIVYIEDDHEVPIKEDTLVSMNLFGFTPSVFPWLEKYFAEFLTANAMNPKAEFFIPIIVDRMIKDGLARMKVLPTDEQWFGVTYKEDRPHVLEMIYQLVKKGSYPPDLWRNYEQRY